MESPAWRSHRLTNHQCCLTTNSGAAAVYIYIYHRCVKIHKTEFKLRGEGLVKPYCKKLTNYNQAFPCRSTVTGKYSTVVGSYILIWIKLSVETRPEICIFCKSHLGKYYCISKSIKSIVTSLDISPFKSVVSATKRSYN